MWILLTAITVPIIYSTLDLSSTLESKLIFCEMWGLPLPSYLVNIKLHCTISVLSLPIIVFGELFTNNYYWVTKLLPLAIMAVNLTSLSNKISELTIEIHRGLKPLRQAQITKSQSQ